MSPLRKLLFPVVTITFFLFSCSEEDTTPKITAIEPLIGDYNEEITLSGVNFDEVLSNNYVRFGTERAEIVSGSKTQLVVKVPANASSGKIEITNNNGSSFSSQEFTVTAGSWAPKTSSPEYLSAGSARTMIINNAAYIIRGKTNVVNGPSDPAMLLKYDGSTWTPLTIYDTDLNGWYETSWGASNGKGYVLDGSNKFMEYNPTTNAWTQKGAPNLTGITSNPMAGFAIGEIGYLQFANVFKIYNPADNTWGTLPTNLASLTLTDPMFASSGTKAYLACKEGIYQLDPTLGNWSFVTEIPDFYFYSTAAFFLSGKDELFLGSTGDMINETWKYDLLTKVWTQKRGFNIARSQPVSFSLTNKYYVGMGSDAQPPNILRSDLYMYTAN